MRYIKYIDIKEFRELGFLQEVNRKFFHPLGLALEIVIDDNDNYILKGIWDSRDDPEGIYFGPNVIKQKKIDLINSLLKSKQQYRISHQDEYGVKFDEDGIQII